VGITAQLGKLVHAGKSGVQISEETAGYTLIVSHGVGLESGSQDADLGVEDLLEAVGRPAHGISGEDKWTRWALARAYSRQTSCGASCT
jgi:hypothetical protein